MDTDMLTIVNERNEQLLSRNKALRKENEQLKEDNRLLLKILGNALERQTIVIRREITDAPPPRFIVVEDDSQIVIGLDRR